VRLSGAGRCGLPARPYPKQFCCAPQFVSQPFLVGDRVDIATSSGSKALSGTVERIDPMRTILRTDHDVPITIPNKASGLLRSQNEIKGWLLGRQGWVISTAMRTECSATSITTLEAGCTCPQHAAGFLSTW